MTKRLPKLIAAAGLATLAVAAPASADSISFLRGGDVWVASPDGAKQVQITHSGLYSYQSQADDGTFIALAGRRLHRLDRRGTVLADFSTPVSGDVQGPDGSKFRGPFRPEISPDGTKVVYEYFWDYQSPKPGCVPVEDPRCIERHTYQGVAYSHADRSTGWDEPGMGKRSGWIHPSWVDGDTIVGSHPSEPLNDEVVFNDMGAPEFQDWFTDEAVWNIADGELSRQGDKAVFITTKPYGYSGGIDDGQVTIYRTTGPAPAVPQRCMSYTSNTVSASPTFSPAGDRVAWDILHIDNATQTYVHHVDVGDANAACDPDGDAVPGRPLIDDAQQPDWGPADVPAAGAETPTTPGKGGDVPPPDHGHGGGGGTPEKSVATTQRRTVRLGRRALARALRGGFVVRFRAPAAGVAAAKATLGGRAVASGSRRAAQAGTVAVRLRVGARGRRALRGRRSARLVVGMTFRAA